MKTAMIFGVTGQDGSYLSELLLTKGYKVVGVKRRSSIRNDSRIAHLLSNKNFTVEFGDVTDFSSVARIINRHCPHEIYNLAAQSHVKVSFDEPIHTTNSTYLGCLNILEAIRIIDPDDMDCWKPRFYQASSSEMFGTSVNCGGFQSETTPFLPCSPYAVAKLAAHHLCNVYRHAHGVFACSGILYNHEGPRRGEEFVTKKISQYVAKYVMDVPGLGKLKLGNIEASRDWGYAGDYVEAMWLMLQQDTPDDFVIATGETHTVAEFVEAAFAVQGIQPGEAWRAIEIDENMKRPFEVPMLKGDATKAFQKLGWKPKTSFKELVEKMVGYDFGMLNN